MVNIQYIEGNGTTDDRLQLIIALPDANGGTATVTGSVQQATQLAVSVNASLALPAAPGSGLIFYNLQVDLVSGVVTVMQDPAVFPQPVSPTARVIFNQVLSPSNIDPAYDPNSSTPDPSLGQA